MSSREIADLSGKAVGHVHRDIKTQLYEVLYGFYVKDNPNLDHIDIKGIFMLRRGNGQICEIRLDRYHADILVSGYEVKYRAAIVKRWHELERNQFAVPTTFVEALRLAADRQEALDRAEAKIAMDRPKVVFAEAVRNMQGACSIGDIAKVLGTGRNRFYKLLKEDGISMGNRLPYQQYIDRELFVVIEQVPYTDSNAKPIRHSRH